MSTPVKNIRLSESANTALKRVVAKFPEWSEAQLASKLLVEACEAALNAKALHLPTLNYLRAQVAGVDTAAQNGRLFLNELRELLASDDRLTDDSPEYRAKAPARRAGGK